MLSKLKAICIKVGGNIHKYFVDNRILPQIAEVLVDGLATVVSLVKVPILLLVILTSGFSTAWIESILIGGFLAVVSYSMLIVKLGIYDPTLSAFMYIWVLISIIAFIANTGMRQLYKNWRINRERIIK